MSMETVAICDVLKCGELAVEHFKYMSVRNFNINQERMDTSDGIHIWTEPDVDLCSKHAHEYKESLRPIVLNQMKGVLNAKKER